MKIKNSLIIQIILTSSIAFSQTGPGGVGSSTSNTLWLEGDNISQVDGTPINTWVDKSGNSNDATQTTIGYQPRFDSLIVNGHSVVRFDGEDDYFDDARTYDARSFFSVYNIQTGVQKVSDLGQIWGSYSEGWHVALDARSGGGTWSFDGSPGLNSGNTARFGLNGGTYGAFGSNPSTPNWTYDQFDLLSVEFNATRTLTRQILGSLIPQFSVGDHQFGGDVAEVIVYNIELNSAQRIIVENYLSAKYGLSLSVNDVYNEDDVLSGNFDNDVAGIGRVDGLNIHNDAQGGIVRVLNPTNLDDDEFFIWGHDNGVLQSTNISDLPFGVQARFDRQWRVSETNVENTASVNVGNIDISWDLRGLGSVTASDLRLIVDNDNDGVFNDETAISGAVDLGDGIFAFQNVSSLDNNERFTLGTINKLQTPLPIELLSFSASLIEDKKIKLEWQTASEINNNYFTIEKSINGSEWEILKTIEGAGNSSNTIKYETTDQNPYFGISYYRLKQTDFDGLYKYSNIKTVKIDNSITEAIQIYPNPTNSEIMVIGNTFELNDVRIFNTLGQDISNSINIKSQNESVLTIDLTHLVKGIYYVKTKTTFNKVYKQ